MKPVMLRQPIQTADYLWHYYKDYLVYKPNLRVQGEYACMTEDCWIRFESKFMNVPFHKIVSIMFITDNNIVYFMFEFFILFHIL